MVFDVKYRGPLMTAEHKIAQSRGQYIIDVSLSLQIIAPQITTYTYQVTWLAGVGKRGSTHTAKNHKEIFILKKEFFMHHDSFSSVTLLW